MTAKEQAVEWLAKHKGCGWHCRKCNLSFQRSFDALDEVARQVIVDAICSCDLEDFEKLEQLLWLVALLNNSEFEKFVARISKLAPFEKALAWQVIRLSAGNQGRWRFDLAHGRLSYCKPCFHLHPNLAPLLLAATIRAGSESEDATALLDYFAPIASSHPALQQAMPHWQAARDHREEERRAEWLRQKEQERLDAENLKAQWAARETEFRTIEAKGPTAILRAILDAPSLNAWDCSERWAKIPETMLNKLPREMLDQIMHWISSQPHSRYWSGLHSRIEHLRKSQTHSTQRTELLSQLDRLSFGEKLQAACDSRWSLTYFPEGWAEQFVRDTTEASKELRANLLSKLMRLQRRSSWRTVRKLLLHKK